MAASRPATAPISRSVSCTFFHWTSSACRRARASSTTLAGARDTKLSLASFPSRLVISRSVSASFFRSFSISAPRSACGIWMCTRRWLKTRVTISVPSAGAGAAAVTANEVSPASAVT